MLKAKKQINKEKCELKNWSGKSDNERCKRLRKLIIIGDWVKIEEYMIEENKLSEENKVKLCDLLGEIKDNNDVYM